MSIPSRDIFADGSNDFARALAASGFTTPSWVDAERSDAPAFDQALGAVADRVGGAFDSAGGLVGGVVDTAADVGARIGLVAAATTTAAFAAIADEVAQRRGAETEARVAIDGDGDGMPGIAPEMQAALGCADQQDVFAQLRRAFEGHAEVMCAQAGLDQNDIRLAGDPALAIAAAQEAMAARSGFGMSA